MSAVDIIERQGDLLVSSETIAEGAGVEHRAVLQLIGNNISDFQDFGEVAFEMRPGYNNAPVRLAMLNEQQATLLMTFQRNTAQVREFKKALVRAFFDMARRLTAPPVPQSLPDALRAYALEVEAREALEAKVAADAPKVDAYDAFMEADGTYSVGSTAKMLGLSQNKLFQLLRNAGVFIAKGPMHNTPYQKYMHHFVVKATPFERSNGEMHTAYTTRVQPSGVTFIRNKLQLTDQ